MYRGKHVRHGKLHQAIRWLFLAIVLGLLIWPFAEPYTLELEQTVLEDSSFPADVRQLRIVYVADFHQGSWPFMTRSRVESIVSRINALNADLVLLGGDYAANSKGTIDFFRQLPGIHANYGIYAVLGECDCSLEEGKQEQEEYIRQLRQAMRSVNVTPLINAVEPVRIGSSTIYLAGLDDITNGWPDLKNLAASVRKEDYVIFLSHNPAVIPDAQIASDRNGRNNWFDLALFGHTHGKQVSLFGIGLLGISDVDNHYQGGWVEENRVPMLITRGVGTVRLPTRLHSKPQIHLITIRSGK